MRKILLLFVFILFVSANSYGQDICYLRVKNTFKKTDKTERFKALYHKQINTLILVSLNNPKEVMNLVYEQGGRCTINFYINGVLQSTKTVHRRSDLESNDGKLIYASRTGEVIVSLFY